MPAGVGTCLRLDLRGVDSPAGAPGKTALHVSVDSNSDGGTVRAGIQVGRQAVTGCERAAFRRASVQVGRVRQRRAGARRVRL